MAPKFVEVSAIIGEYSLIIQKYILKQSK